MRAAVVKRYGPPSVATVIDVPVPEPAAGQVLVKVGAAAVTSGDARIRAARFPRGFAPFARPALGLRGPRRGVLGMAGAGVVERLGPGVTGFSPGDRVAAMTGARMGMHAEYVLVAADRLVPVPAGISDEDAAGVLFGGTTALQYLRDKCGITAGASVLVVGASGAVGSNAVQLAKYFGAGVTGVTSGRNAELVSDLGADRIIDYTRVALETVSDQFDIVLDTVGTLTIRSGRRLLNPQGRLGLAVGGLGQTIAAVGQVKAGPAAERPADSELLMQLLSDGRLVSVTDRVLALEEIVAAHERVDSGRKVGNVIVRP